MVDIKLETWKLVTCYKYNWWYNEFPSLADSAGKWNIEKPDFWLGTWADKMDSWQFQCHLELPTPKLHENSYN